MEQLDACRTSTKVDKCNNEDTGSSVHRKSSKKFKSKKRRVNKKKNRKHKEKRKCSSSSSESDDSDKFEWVERKGKDQVLPCTAEELVDSKTPENQLKRDEWMKVESFVPYLSKSNKKPRRSDVKEGNKIRILLNEPGQSDRELNPHWKDGGDGLPQNNLGEPNNTKILDANWLKKSLRRAEEQAIRDGKSLEKVAAERWGSLETIQTMIMEAERMSNSERNKLCHKRYHNDRNDKDLHRISNARIRRHSKPRSRSRERARKDDTSDYSSQYRTELKQTNRKPKDNDDYYQEIVPTGSRIRNWKKDKNNEKQREISKSSEQKEVDLEDSANEMDKSKDVGVLTEAEMNKLGARIIKAELMGDDELAGQLKIQLERARKHVASYSTNVQEDNVILTRIDAKGIARAIQPGSQSKRFAENNRKVKTAETHISGERVRHFVDDDKYSLQEMFQREKRRSTNEDEAMFIKLASRSVDHMDDTFEQQIARTDLEGKQDRRDRVQAIREHRGLSKYMDNCWWCLDSQNMLKHMVVTMDSAICLSLPARTSLTTGHCILTPVQHVACQLRLDEDVWDRLKELKRKLIEMFTNENLYPIFFEVYKRCCKFSHMQLECIPLPKEIGESAPIYFKKALLECETEWSVNKKIVDLTCKGIRHAVPNGLAYFMIEFASHSGYAHVIEDEEIFPQNFAKEIIAGMLDLDHNLWRKPKRQSFEEQRVKVLEFAEKWKKYNSP